MTDRQDLKEALNEVLDDRRSLDETTHSLHHRFIGEWIEDRERKKALREKIKANVIVWGVIGALSAFGVMVWDSVKRALSD